MPQPDATYVPKRTRSPSPEPRGPLRRSTRARRAPPPPPNARCDEPETVPQRLEQIPFAGPEVAAAAAPRLAVQVHPVAMALMSFHAHLTRTEVIGYLAGSVRRGQHGVDVVVLAAFPCKELNERALAKTGRSAYTEVELAPADSVGVYHRVSERGMSVVGWYHSHPDEAFTVEPSRVDIENQLNYQTMLFQDEPFVAAIVAPYNSDLPDHHPDVAFFRVWEETTPIRLPYVVSERQVEEVQALGDALNEFTIECLGLIEAYSNFAKRKRLQKSWRGDVSGIDKMSRALSSLHNNGGFLEVMANVLEELARAWKKSSDAEEERRERNKNAAKKKKARKN